MKTLIILITLAIATASYAHDNGKTEECNAMGEAALMIAQHHFNGHDERVEQMLWSLSGLDEWKTTSIMAIMTYVLKMHVPAPYEGVDMDALYDRIQQEAVTYCNENWPYDN